MSILSYLHQLFDVQTCYAYIHRLCWKDRPLQCPRCQSQDVDPWGNYHYRPGVKRYWCNGCERTFNDLTNTLLHTTWKVIALVGEKIDNLGNHMQGGQVYVPDCRYPGNDP